MIFMSGLASMALIIAYRFSFRSCFSRYYSISRIDLRQVCIQNQVSIMGSIRKAIRVTETSSFFQIILLLQIGFMETPRMSRLSSLCVLSSKARRVEILMSPFVLPSLLAVGSSSTFLPTRLICFEQSNTMSQQSGMLCGSTYDRNTSFYFFTLILPRLISARQLLLPRSSPMVVLREAILGSMRGCMMLNELVVSISFWKASTPVMSLSCSPFIFIFSKLSSMSWKLSLLSTSSDFSVFCVSGCQGGGCLRVVKRGRGAIFLVEVAMSLISILLIQHSL